MERALILSENGHLKLSDFQVGITEPVAKPESVAVNDEIWDLEQAELRLIKKALDKANNNKSKTAELLNISWQSLDRRMKKFEIS